MSEIKKQPQLFCCDDNHKNRKCLIPEIWFDLFVLMQQSGEYNMSPISMGNYDDVKKMHDFLTRYSILKIKDKKYFKATETIPFHDFASIFETIAMNYDRLKTYYDYSHKQDNKMTEVKE